MSDTRTVLFGEKAAGVYLLSTIYDPDVDGSDVNASGKIVPAVGSLIVDDTTGLHNEQYTVVAVDNTTYKVTMVPSTYVTSSTAEVDRVLSYGNDIYMLYYSTVKVAVDGININLTRLIVDNKLSLFGNYAATYQLVRGTALSGDQEVISKWYVNNTYKGASIPMLETGVSGIRKCDGCYTEVNDLADGDIIYCNIYAASGLMIATIQLIAKEAHMLNEMTSTANPITSMTIEANQMTDDGYLFLYQNQNTEELAVFVLLHYSDGSNTTIAIDNIRGFIYGLEQLNTSNVDDVGVELLVKYYLSDADITGLPTESDEASSTTFISACTLVKVISLEQETIAKISPIPVWNNSGYWELRYLCYRQSRAFSPSGTDVVSSTNFTGSTFGTTQEVDITTDQIIYGQAVAYNQSFVIELRNKADSLNVDNNVDWLISESINSETTYGDDTDDYVRPAISYKVGIGYYINSDTFSATSNQSAVEVFLENFYTRATPPRLLTEAIAPTPTHFLVKSIDSTGVSSLMTSRRDINDFTTALNLDIKSGLANRYVGTTLVVEFYRVTDTTDEVLYGVPVDVVQV